MQGSEASNIIDMNNDNKKVKGKVASRIYLNQSTVAQQMKSSSGDDNTQGVGSLSNDKIKNSKICAADGFSHKPIIFRSSSSSSNDNINNLVEKIAKRFDDIDLRIDASQRAIANLLAVLRILQEQLNNLKFQVRNL